MYNTNWCYIEYNCAQCSRTGVNEIPVPLSEPRHEKCKFNFEFREDYTLLIVLAYYVILIVEINNKFNNVKNNCDSIMTALVSKLNFN